MSNALKLVSTKNMEKDAWLEFRNKGIGGSDAAVVCGLSKWKSPLSLWLEKTGQITPSEIGEAGYWGNMLEDLVAKEFEQRSGLKVKRCNYILQHPQHEWMLANIDREIVGHKAGLECKTTSAYSKDDWIGDNIPDQYYCQVQHYMAVTGADTWYIAVLIGGQKFEYKEVKRDQAFIDRIIEIESAFWQHVVNNTMPEVDGSEDCSTVLLSRFPVADGNKIELPPTAAEIIAAYHKAKADEDDAKQRKELHAQKLQMMLGTAETGIHGDYLVSWSTVKGRETFDSKTFKAKHPDLYQQFAKIGEPTRRFSIKGGI